VHGFAWAFVNYAHVLGSHFPVSLVFPAWRLPRTRHECFAFVRCSKNSFESPRAFSSEFACPRIGVLPTLSLSLSLSLSLFLSLCIHLHVFPSLCYHMCVHGFDNIMYSLFVYMHVTHIYIYIHRLRCGCILRRYESLTDLCRVAFGHVKARCVCMSLVGALACRFPPPPLDTYLLVCALPRPINEGRSKLTKSSRD